MSYTKTGTVYTVFCGAGVARLFPVSLDCPFLTAPSVFSHVYLIYMYLQSSKRTHNNKNCRFSLQFRISHTLHSASTNNFNITYYVKMCHKFVRAAYILYVSVTLSNI